MQICKCSHYIDPHKYTEVFIRETQQRIEVQIAHIIGSQCSQGCWQAQQWQIYDGIGNGFALTEKGDFYALVSVLLYNVLC